MKIGDFVKVSPKYVSPLTLKLHNGNPMGIVIWCSTSSPEVWAQVMLLNGQTLSFPSSVLTRTETVLDKTSEPDTLLPYPGGAA